MSPRSLALLAAVGAAVAGPAGRAGAYEYTSEAGVWVLALDHAEVTRVAARGRLAADFLPGPAQPVVAGVLTAIKLVDRAGGDNGVCLISSWSLNPLDVRPVLLLPNTPATARLAAGYVERNRATRGAVRQAAGRVAEAVHGAAAFAGPVDLSGRAFDPARALADRTRRGAASARALFDAATSEVGVLVRLTLGLDGNPEPAAAEEASAKARPPVALAARSREPAASGKFALLGFADGTVSLVGTAGHLTADRVSAACDPAAGGRARWGLTLHPDGAVSLSAADGCFLCAGEGGRLTAGLRTAGVRERFGVEFRDGGFHLRSHAGHYLCAAESP